MFCYNWRQTASAVFAALLLASSVAWTVQPAIAQTASAPVGLFDTSQLPSGTVFEGRRELGVAFVSSVDGTVESIRFYKAEGEFGLHTGRIWDLVTGEELVRASFQGETASGWQEAVLATPLPVVAGRHYVVSVGINAAYVVSPGGLSEPVTSGPLATLRDRPAGLYGRFGSFPGVRASSENYFVDVGFRPAPVAPPVEPSGTSIVVRASGTPAFGTFPKFAVRVDGTTIGTATVASTAGDHRFDTLMVPDGAGIDVVFLNDAIDPDGNDRNLFVDSVTVGETVLRPTDPGVVYDRGSGAAAFDGLDVLTGRRGLYWAGALRFTLPGLRLAANTDRLDRPGLLVLTATASPDIARVVLYRDGALVAEDDTAPFAFDLPYIQTLQAAQGFEARGIDAAGTARASDRLNVDVAITGRVLFVAPTGNDANSGLSPAAPKQTPQSAAGITLPGDTVLVMNGTYTEANPRQNVLTITRQGTPDAWIAYMAYPGHRPFIKAANWNGISVQASYIIVDGFTLEGNRADISMEYALSQANNLNNPLTSGNGIGIAPYWADQSRRPHHVVIRNNVVRDFPGGGIYTNQADYVTIENNRVYRNAWYSPYANSGISFYQSWNSDTNTGTKLIVRGNLSFENHNYIPFFYSNNDPARRVVSDGNGIIVDDHRHTQKGSTHGDYLGRTLIENNIVYGNGGRGINIYSSDYVDVVNNTSWMNGAHDNIPSEFATNRAKDVFIANNIFVARDGKTVNQIGTGVNIAENIVYDCNVLAGGTLSAAVTSRTMRDDPRFMDPANAIFRLQPGSPAIDTGCAARAPAADFDGLPRPQGSGIDRGAYETMVFPAP